MRTVSAGVTDTGKKRPHNEDALVVDDIMGLYIVADGVGVDKIAGIELQDHRLFGQEAE